MNVICYILNISCGRNAVSEGKVVNAEFMMLRKWVHIIPLMWHNFFFCLFVEIMASIT